MKIIKVVLFFFTLLMMLVSCADNMDAAPPAPEKEKTIEDVKTELNELNVKINTLIGEARCDAVDQCRLVELGSRPCGGPDSYKAYSIRNTDVDALLKASGAHVALSKTFNELNNRVSICSVLEKPKLLCKQTCITEEVTIMLQ